MCYGSCHQNKSYTFFSQILTIRTPYAMHIEAKSARCWKYSPDDFHAHFPPGSTFHLNRNAVATGLAFVNLLCTQSESKLPILMENKKNQQITLQNGRIRFSSLDISDTDEPKYPIRNPCEPTTQFSRQMDNSTILSYYTQQFHPSHLTKKVYGNEN